MSKFDLNSVKDCNIIFAKDDYVILAGKNPWLFRKDGTFVRKYPRIRHAYNMVFLPDNKALLEGAGDKGYHLISLDTGEVLWRFPQRGSRIMGPWKFAVSQDGSLVYYVYRNTQRVLSIDVFQPAQLECTTYSLPLERLCAIPNCYCDENGNLCLLVCHSLKNQPEDTSPRVFTGILQWHPKDQTPIWKHQWIGPIGSLDCTARACNDEYALLDSLKVRNIKTGEIINLLENQGALPPFFGGYSVKAYDPASSLLTLRFTWSASNIIIDCKERKIIAHYVPISTDFPSGCLIDGSFWIGSPDGVVKRPFPHMDPFPKKF